MERVMLASDSVPYETGWARHPQPERHVIRLCSLRKALLWYRGSRRVIDGHRDHVPLVQLAETPDLDSGGSGCKSSVGYH